MSENWTVWLAAYAAALVVFLALDAIWLGWIARPAYQDGIGHLLADRPKLGAAAVFYALYVAGIVWFAVVPHVPGGSAVGALLSGGLLGLLAYGTYDVTNYATLRDWPLTVTALDLTWGTVLTAVSALAGYSAASHLAG